MRGPSFLLQRRIATVLAIAFATGASAATPDAELILPVTINEVSRGETPVIITADDIFVPLGTLERAGLTGAMWQRVQLVAGLRSAERRIQNERAVSLKALAPWATYDFNEANLTLSVAFKPDLMQRRAFSIAGARPPDISYRNDTSGFFNYALSSTGGKGVSGFGEAAATYRRALFYTSFSETPEEGFIRGFSSVSYDQREVLRRWTAGDAPIFSDELGGTGLVAGLTVSRSFDIDPYFIRYPSLSLRGMATTPSQVDVYVNGVLVSRQTVEPGPFDVQNLPGVAGPTSTQVVVRDVFGREQTQSSSFYYSTAVLGRGLSDYIYSAGVLRKAFSSASFDYDEPVLLGYHRYGITDRLTVAARVEATDSVVSAGSGLAFASRLGDLDFKFGGSSSGDGETGTAAQVGVRRLSRRANLSAAFRMFSRGYQNFSLGPETDRPLTEAVVSAAYLPRWGNVGLQWSTAKMRDSGNRNRLALLTNIPILDRLDLMLSGAVTDIGDDTISEYFVGFSMHGWDRNTVNLGAARTNGADAVSAEIQQPLPVGDGWGYRLQTTTGLGQTDGGAAVQYQNRYGRYEVNTPLRKGSVTANVAGGLVIQGGRVVPTRPVAQSFALVRVPGVENVRVYLSNQLIGRTDGSGDLLVPNLLSYYGNRVRIDDRDVPMNYDVQVIEQTIAPSNRGGALVEFPVRAIRTVVGTVIVKTGAATSVPAYGQITFSRGGAESVSPLGGAGEFYFENLTSGDYKALVEYETGSCSFSVRIPDGKEATIELGQVICAGTLKP